MYELTPQDDQAYENMKRFFSDGFDEKDRAETDTTHREYEMPHQQKTIPGLGSFATKEAALQSTDKSVTVEDVPDYHSVTVPPIGTPSGPVVVSRDHPWHPDNI